MREHGFYWVRITSEWTIAEWRTIGPEPYWAIAGNVGDDYLNEIDERRIVRYVPVPTCTCNPRTFNGNGVEETCHRPPCLLAPGRPEQPKFSGATCKGCYSLGSACGNCERCKWEREVYGPWAGTITRFPDLSKSHYAG